MRITREMTSGSDMEEGAGGPAAHAAGVTPRPIRARMPALNHFLFRCLSDMRNIWIVLS